MRVRRKRQNCAERRKSPPQGYRCPSFLRSFLSPIAVRSPRSGSGASALSALGGLASARSRAHSCGVSRTRAEVAWMRDRGDGMDEDLTQEERAALIAQVERLREEHRDLDTAIGALSDAGQAADRLQLQRLKKRKLMLRDKLAMLEDRLTPDIIA